MKIVVAIDSFKSTLSSIEISHIFQDYYESCGHHVIKIPLSDGGEGFVTALKHHFQEDLIDVDTSAPLGDVLKSQYIIHDHVGYIGLSDTSGIDKIEHDRLNPMQTTTYGLGLVIKDAIQKGCKKIVIGIGGSATNDAASGMLQALGVKFYKEKDEIKTHMNGSLLKEVSSINTSELDELIKDISFEVASDVKNPLLGPDGCAYTYAKQKGADALMIEQLELYMTHYASIVEHHFNQSYRFKSGAGAAGGFGFGAMAFLDANIHLGIDFMIHMLDIESKIKESDVVITGEGKLDRQSTFGKLPYGIAELAKKHHKKSIGIFAVKESDVNHDVFDDIYVIVPKYADEKTSLDQTKDVLIKMIEDIKIQK